MLARNSQGFRFLCKNMEVIPVTYSRNHLGKLDWFLAKGFQKYFTCTKGLYSGV